MTVRKDRPTSEAGTSSDSMLPPFHLQRGLVLVFDDVWNSFESPGNSGFTTQGSGLRMRASPVFYTPE